MSSFSLAVSPSIPERLARLPELANNLFFSWHRPIRALFEDLDRPLWAEVRGNPKLLLRCVDQTSLNAAALDPEYTARYDEVLGWFDTYLAVKPAADAPLVAYFCAEYGFNHGFPIYSGGLGVLAGDHCKAASDEALNFVAIGLLYGQGYFIQNVDSDGVQHAIYRDHDLRDLPVEPLRDPTGAWRTVSVPIAGRNVLVRLWEALVGRIRVVLLDTDCPENSAEDRDITHRLYGGDDGTRIRQEMVLGIGGVRALRALGLAPAVWHMNEGHAAFLVLERLRETMGAGVPFGAALEAVAAQCAFTTHTPVAAGHDAFSHDLLLAHFNGFVTELGLPLEQFLALGRAPGHGGDGRFNMTQLALAGARHVNGVSRLHGAVSAQLVAGNWPQVPPEENPVGYVTNGVHVPTFLHQHWAEFFDEVAGPAWRERLSDEPFWRLLERVPDSSFWASAQTVKSDMLAAVRERLAREFARKGQSAAQMRSVARHLDSPRPEVLTIGFARRFATYKRAALLLRDRARLARIVNDPERPVLFLFAGKAHPADQPGQAVLREIKQLMLQPEFIGRVVFLEDYDIQLARWLVAGCDVWLNNPIAPLEASGTSGIKAAVNGRLNLSILDGWWAEGFEGDNGWGIPPVDVEDAGRRDTLEAELILQALEQEVVPLYYARNETGCPTEWVRRCKRAMMTAIPRFNMRRVVADYSFGIYRPTAAHGAKLARDGYAGARELDAWKHRVRERWSGVALQLRGAAPRRQLRSEPLRIEVAVELAGLSASDVRVEFVARRVVPDRPHEPIALCSYRDAPHAGYWAAELVPSGPPDGGTQVYRLDIPTEASGKFEAEVRVTPAHPMLTHPNELGLMKVLAAAG
jgi:starch phosphorylase